MKTNIVVRIVIYSIVLFLLIGILAAGIGMKLFTFRSHTETTVMSTEIGNVSVPTAQLDTIQVDWAAGNIHVLPDSNTEEIQITQFSTDTSANPMAVDTSGSKLIIRFSDKDIHFGINSLPKKDLEIRIPAYWSCEKLSFDTAACDVSIENMNVSEVELNAASGNFMFADCNVEKLEADCASADIRYNGTLKKFDFDSHSGSAEMTLWNNPTEINMNAMSGDLTLNLPSDCGFNLETDTISGKVNCDFPFTKHNNWYVVGDGSCKITVDGASCKMTIHDNHSNASGFGERNHHEEAHH